MTLPSYLSSSTFFVVGLKPFGSRKYSLAYDLLGIFLLSFSPYTFVDTYSPSFFLPLPLFLFSTSRYNTTQFFLNPLLISREDILDTLFYRA